jgi:hypothetical protein
MALRGERRFISQPSVTSGILLEFTYRSNRDNVTKTYVVLVIDPNRGNYLHGLLVDDLSDEALIRLIVQLGNFTFDPENPSRPLTDLRNDDAYRKYSAIKHERRYRTFLRSNISNLRQILVGGVA